MRVNATNLELHQINYRQNRQSVCNLLVDNLKLNGQLNPIKVIEKDSKYFVVDGWRRVLALRVLNRDVWIEIISDDIKPILSDFMDVKRRSDYEQFCILQYLVNRLKISYLNLANQLGISKDRFYNLFSFKDLDSELVKSIKDFRMVSASTAKEMRSIQKSKEGLKILIDLADDIRFGLGASKLREKVASLREKAPRQQLASVVIGEDRKPIGVYRGRRQFTFDDGIVNRFSKDVLQEALTRMISYLNQGSISIRQ